MQPELEIWRGIHQWGSILASPPLPFLSEPRSNLRVTKTYKSRSPLLTGSQLVEQTQGQRQTGRNDLPGKGERVASGW